MCICIVVHACNLAVFAEIELSISFALISLSQRGIGDFGHAPSQLEIGLLARLAARQRTLTLSGATCRRRRRLFRDIPRKHLALRAAPYVGRTLAVVPSFVWVIHPLCSRFVSRKATSVWSHLVARWTPAPPKNTTDVRFPASRSRLPGPSAPRVRAPGRRRVPCRAHSLATNPAHESPANADVRDARARLADA